MHVVIETLMYSLFGTYDSANQIATSKRDCAERAQKPCSARMQRALKLARVYHNNRN